MIEREMAVEKNVELCAINELTFINGWIVLVFFWFFFCVFCLFVLFCIG